MTDPSQRIAALAACFDEETAADIEAVILHRHAGRVLSLQAIVQELRNAGLATQADEVLRRINEQSPQSSPPLPGLPQPILNGSTAAVPLPRARRGRPPKGGSTS